MALLIIEEPGAAPLTIPLTGTEIQLGRAEDNDVVLKTHEVSRRHAKLIPHGAGYVLTDLDSLNGTYVNQQRVSEHHLAHNDEVWLGTKCYLRFLDASHGSGEGTDHSGTSIDLSGDRWRDEGDTLSKLAKRGADEAGDTGLHALSQTYQRLAALYEASKVLASEFDLPKRLTAVLDTAVEVMEADRGFLMLRKTSNAPLEVRVAREMGQDLKASSPSMSVAGKAAATGNPVLVRDAREDREFGGQTSIIQQLIVSAMAAPLRVEDRVLGSIYLDTRQPDRQFGEDDLELFAALATPLAMAIENVRLYEAEVDNEKTRANLGRFLSPAIVDMVMQSAGAITLGGEKRTVSTLFCDVRGFTTIAEELAPTTLVEMLNEHFTHMTDIIFDESGTLDKFIGDEIMAVFGAPFAAEDDAVRAVRSALRMQSVNTELNAARAKRGLPPFNIGIGIATGEVVAGYVGAPERMEYTVAGDRVNIARRLCDQAETNRVVADEATYELVRDSVDARPIGTCFLKGKSRTIRAYEILRCAAGKAANNGA
ncbi:MAG: adenylate/guanylate cyclase domain-containing protein [Candidatus Hydrogenedentota bacterium]